MEKLWTCTSVCCVSRLCFDILGDMPKFTCYFFIGYKFLNKKNESHHVAIYILLASSFFLVGNLFRLKNMVVSKLEHHLSIQRGRSRSWYRLGLWLMVAWINWCPSYRTEGHKNSIMWHKACPCPLPTVSQRISSGRDSLMGEGMHQQSYIFNIPDTDKSLSLLLCYYLPRTRAPFDQWVD